MSTPGNERRAGSDRRRADRRRPERRGGVVLVELVRLVVVAGFTAIGYQIARSTVTDARSTLILVMAVLGAGIGYVAGGLLGRLVGRLVGVAERRIAATPGADFVAGALGLIVGVIAASLLGWPLLLLPVRAVGVSVLAFVLVVVGYLGFRIGILKREDVLQLVGLTHRTRAGDLRVLDTSAVLDTRLIDYVRAGLLRGTLLVATFVLEEAQGIADGADPVRRQRARHGLEALTAIRREGLAEVQLVEKTYPEFDQVDAKVMALARERGAAMVTDDIALARVAELQGIEVVMMRQIAAALRPAALPGERISLQLVREGKEPGQAVGYLEDGTMVVVEEGAASVGMTIEVEVSRAVSTTGGRMLFARVAAP